MEATVCRVSFVRALRSPTGNDLVLNQKIFIEEAFAGGVIRRLAKDEIAEYGGPCLTARECRPMLTWLLQIFLGGEGEACRRCGSHLEIRPLAWLKARSRSCTFTLQEGSPTELGVAICPHRIWAPPKPPASHITNAPCGHGAPWPFIGCRGKRVGTDNAITTAPLASRPA